MERRCSKYQTRNYRQKDSQFLLLKVAKCWKPMKPGVSTKKVFLEVFTVSMSSQVISFPVFSLGLLSSSFCIENGGNSQKSNPSATLHIEIEFLTKFLNMSKLQYRADFSVLEDVVTYRVWKISQIEVSQARSCEKQQYFRYLNMFDLINPVFLFNLVSKMDFSKLPFLDLCWENWTKFSIDMILTTQFVHELIIL